MLHTSLTTWGGDVSMEGHGVGVWLVLQLRSSCVHSLCGCPALRIQKGFQVPLLFQKLTATSSSSVMRNVSFRFAGAKPSGKARFPRWPNRVLIYLDQTVHVPIQVTERCRPGGLGFASNVHLVLGKKSKCEEEGEILLPLSQRHPHAKEMCALDGDRHLWWSGHC